VRWVGKASLTDARRAVTCVEFAPRQWGLKLAVGSADGCVRIYEAVDIMNLAQWILSATIQAFAEGSKLGCTSISWCTGRFEPPTLVAGGSQLIVYRYSDNPREWRPLLQLPGPDKGDVLDVSWAPNVGRRFHYIASAEGEQLRVYKLSREAKGDAADPAAKTSGGGATIGRHLSLASSQTVATNAWRCEWNVTGTVLASSGDGGVVHLWKPNFEGQFRCVSKVQGLANPSGGLQDI